LKKGKDTRAHQSLRLLRSPSDARLDSNSWQGYAMKLEALQGGILLRCGVCLEGTSRGIYMVPRSIMWQKLSWRRCCRGAGQLPCVAGRPGLGGEPTSLPRILSCCHMERYSHGGLDLASCKVGLASQGVGRLTALLGPPGRASAYGVHMVRGWPWWPWFDILLNFPLWHLKITKFHT
jgi:hypothetical protein